MTLDQVDGTPRQEYRNLLYGEVVGRSRHPEGAKAAEYWIFTDNQGNMRVVREGHHHEDGMEWLKAAYLGAEADAAGQDADDQVSSGAGHQADSEVRRAVEAYAVVRSSAYLRGQGWVVKPVEHEYLGYDLLCIKPGRTLHVEAKGTQTKGEKVELTEGERKHNQGSCDVADAVEALFVVSQIKVDGLQCSGGKLGCAWPWRIDGLVMFKGALTPSAYWYQVPALKVLT